MKKIDFFKNLDMSEEGILKRRMEVFENTKTNLENMSYWLPKISNGLKQTNSFLQIPNTKIIPLHFDWWRWLISDSYTPEKIKEFNDYLVVEIGDFLKGETLFMKTGIFSNKFEFGNTIVDDRINIGEKFLNMFYASMLVGADQSSEVVVRQMIQNKEERLTIYEGMPLHTEFRIFYDFNQKEVVGVSNYWHPDVMEGIWNLEDKQTYLKEKEKIVSDYNQHKQKIAEEVRVFMSDCTELYGKWSIDVMKNDDEFWLIDMARMERSALVPQMENI